MRTRVTAGEARIVHRSLIFGAFALCCELFGRHCARDWTARLFLSTRRAAVLTQRALARRARTSQSVVAPIESEAASPSWTTLERLLRGAGFDLQVSLTMRARGRSHMLDDVARILRLTPEERLLELRNAALFFAAARRLDNGRI